MGTGGTCFVLMSGALFLGGMLTEAIAAEAPARGVIGISRCQTIDQPGSYIVVANLKASGDCVVITADNVTVDLNDFTLTGDGSGTGIKGPPQSPQGGVVAFSTTVRNGTITHFARATDLTGTLGATAEGVHAVSNGDGIVLAVGNVKGCFALFNTGKGISLFDGLVTGNLVVGNGTGIAVTEAAVMTGNEVLGNTTGIDATGLGSGLSHNVVDGNKEVGLQVQCPANLSDNTALGNGAEKLPTNLVLIGKKCVSSGNLAP